MSDQTASQSAYTDLSLDPKSNFIRLLEVVGNEAGTIECKFHRLSLDDAPNYTALSYTWGSEEDKREILIDGKWVSVRKNLWDFFQQIRSDRKWKLIWIDALCVDQNNSIERNHQVGMMRAIYSKPKRANWQWNIFSIKISTPSQHDGHGLRNKAKQFLVLQTDNTGKDYVVQEIMLPKDLTVLCGNQSVTWSCFSTLKQQLPYMHKYGRWEDVPFACAVAGSAALQMVSKKADWQTLSTTTSGVPLQALLVDFADLECSEIKDKVFALLGIAQPFFDGSRIVVDYSKTTAAIYRDVLRHLFFYNDDPDALTKRKFKKILKKSLGLDGTSVMEREPATEARIHIAVEKHALTILKRIETESIKQFQCRSTEIIIPPQQVVEMSQIEGWWLKWALLADYSRVAHAIRTTAIEPETRSLLENVAKRECTAAMETAKTNLSTVLVGHLKNAYELGIRTTMSWVRKSRFEVESSLDQTLDSEMETRMMNILTARIEHSVQDSIPLAIDAALKTAQTSAYIRYQRTMGNNEPWRQADLAKWIYMWRSGQTVVERPEIHAETMITIETWIDHWYNDQMKKIFVRISAMEIAKEHFVERKRTYGMIDDYSLGSYMEAPFGEDLRTVQGWVLDRIRVWHQKNGILDLNPTELQADIMGNIEKAFCGRCGMPQPKQSAGLIST